MIVPRTNLLPPLPRPAAIQSVRGFLQRLLHADRHERFSDEIDRIVHPDSGLGCVV